LDSEKKTKRPGRVGSLPLSVFIGRKRGEAAAEGIEREGARRSSLRETTWELETLIPRWSAAAIAPLLFSF